MQFGAVDREQMPEFIQSVYDRSVELGDTNWVQAGANAPEVLEWYFKDFFGKLVYGGRVDVRTKELMRLRLTRTHGCALCNKADASDALEAGVPAEAVDAVTSWPDPLNPELFSEKELAAFRYADQMAIQNMDGALDPELYTELRRHFDDGELFELGMVMAVLVGMFKFMFIADLTPKMDHCPIPGHEGIKGGATIEPAERLGTDSLRV